MRHIALIGRTASGKGTALEYLSRRHGYVGVTFSSLIQRVAERYGMIGPGEKIDDRIRKTEVSNALARKVGDNYLARAVVDEVASNPGRFYVIDGIRRPAEFAEIRDSLKGAVFFLGIDSGYGVREARFVERLSGTAEDFARLDANDGALGIDSIFENIDARVGNDGTIGEFEGALDGAVAPALGD